MLSRFSVNPPPYTPIDPNPNPTNQLSVNPPPYTPKDQNPTNQACLNPVDSFGRQASLTEQATNYIKASKTSDMVVSSPPASSSLLIKVSDLFYDRYGDCAADQQITTMDWFRLHDWLSRHEVQTLGEKCGLSYTETSYPSNSPKVILARIITRDEIETIGDLLYRLR